MKNCPLEALIKEALDDAGVHYVRDYRPYINGQRVPYSIDFFLAEEYLGIEVKSGSTPRVIRQMQSLPNIIVVQGLESAALVAKWIKGSKKGRES